MALTAPGMRPLNDYFLTTTIADVSTPDTAYISVPDDGYIIKIFTALENAITVADSIVTAEINGVAVTGSSITVAFSGSGNGDVDFSEPTGARKVQEGDNIGIVTDGGSTTAAKLFVTVVIRRSAF